MPPIQGKPLILYISTTVNFLGALLSQKDENGKEKSIYYISNTLVTYQLNYNNIEKSCLDVVLASQKLCH